MMQSMSQHKSKDHYLVNVNTVRVRITNMNGLGLGLRRGLGEGICMGYGLIHLSFY